MRPIDVTNAIEQIGESRAIIAVRIGVPVNTLKAWENGLKNPRGRAAKALATWSAEVSRDRQASEAGYPACSWVESWQNEKFDPGNFDVVERRFKELENHVEACVECKDRKAYFEQHFPDAVKSEGRAFPFLFGIFLKMPKPLRPPIIGAAALVAIVAIPSSLFVIISILSNLNQAFQILGEWLWVVGMAAGFGASGGVVYAFVRPATRSLGVVGDYITGIGSTFGYVVALLWGMPYLDATEEPTDFGDSSTWMLIAFMSVLFGIVVTASVKRAKRKEQARAA